MVDGRINVLVAEDNPAELKLFNIAAAASGLARAIKLDTAINGEEAINKLELAGLQDTPYDLLILDLNMPLVTGPMVLEHLKSDFPNKPIIIVFTNSNNPTDLRACRELGADGYVQKPASFHALEDFCNAIRASIETSGGIEICQIKQRYNHIFDLKYST